jgi:thioredoxin reductase (NADPH)
MTAANNCGPWALPSEASPRAPEASFPGNTTDRQCVADGMATLDLTAQEFNETVNGNDIVLVDFWASWCGPCRAFAPTFAKASEQHPDIVFGKVDTEAEEQLAAAAEIRAIPTLMAFKKGQLVFNQAGALPPAALEDLITQLRDFDVDAAVADPGSTTEV